ncbi:MAG: hypothetical protein JNN15_16870, partial [Blastocatellia bacterium]|nr:hypothetical protein [Blastocatellia bacterium]
EDTYTLRATFPKRIEPIKLIFAKVPIVSKISFSERAVKVGLNDTYSLDTAPDNIVSSGPFVLKSYIPDKQIELSYNKYYWKVDSSGTSLPYLDQVTYALKTPTENQLTSFTRSELHLMKVLPKDIQKLNEGGQFKVADLGTSVNTWQLVLNWRADQKKIDPTKATWFRIPGFRNGLMYAVDRNRIVKEVFDSKAKVAYNQVSPANTTWYNSDINRPEYNLETAKASITKVGFQFDGSGNLKYMGGRVTRFTITHINDYIPTQIANRLVEDLKKVGVEAEADPKDYKTFWKIANLGTFDTLLVQATPMFSDPAFLHPYLTKRGKYFWFYETGQGSTRLVGAGEGWMDKISTRMGEAITKVLLSERRELYNQIQADWNLSAPVVYIASDNVITASQKVIGNFKPATLEPSLTWNIEEFYIK